MSYKVGFDLHSNNTVSGIVDHFGKRLGSKKLPNDLNQILNYLSPFKEELGGILVESTFNWYWLVDGLLEEGYPVYLASPSSLENDKRVKHTDDKYDAYNLAAHLNKPHFPLGYIYPKKKRYLRDLLRTRVYLKRDRIRHILRFKCFTNNHTGKDISSSIIKGLSVREVEELFSDSNVRLTAMEEIELIKYLSIRIDKLDNEIYKQMKGSPILEKLQTVTGIGPILALTISLETGEIKRFKKVGRYTSYCRCAPSNRYSNTKKKGQNNRKNGNPYLEWAFVEAAIFCKRFSPAARNYFNRKLKRTKHFMIAIKALANKIARACYYIQRDLCDYDENKIFGNDLNKMKRGSSKSKKGTGHLGEPNRLIENTAVSNQANK